MVQKSASTSLNKNGSRQYHVVDCGETTMSYSSVDFVSLVWQFTDEEAYIHLLVKEPVVSRTAYDT